MSILFGWLSLAAINWGAGHDIQKDEQDVRLEYTIIWAGLFLARLAIVQNVQKLIGKRKNHGGG
jgi:hypothetical protein